MTKQTQQMPLLMVVGDISHLTDKEAEQIKKYIQLGNILNVQFKDAAGEVMIPTGVIPEVLADDGSVTSNAYVTVIKDGSIVKAEITEKLSAPIIKGTTPFEESTAYEGEITIEATPTIKAIAIKGELESEVASKTFTKS